MKRRDFFTRMALGTAAVVVAPHLLAQEPVKALDPYRNVVNNPYYKWVKAKRSEVHTKDNNYWNVQAKHWRENYMQIVGWDKWDEGEYLIGHPPNTLSKRIYPVHFREYDWVYEDRDPRRYKINHYLRWMNVEDIGFYESLNDKRVFDPHYNHLLGVGLIPGLVDPLNPRGPFYKTPQLSWEGKNPTKIKRTYPVDSYEIHIMYQKIK